MGLLSGLEKFGFDSLEKVQIYEAENKDEKNSDNEEKKEVTEADLLFDKTYTCTVCGKEIKAKTMRVGKAKLMDTDIDMRPKYQSIDPLKYDVISCNYCGYTALTKYFTSLSDAQIRLIKTHISTSFKPTPVEDKDFFTYDEALERHKLALLNAVVKKSRASERAYICMKTAWLLRGQAEGYSKEEPDYDDKVKNCKENEIDCLQEAYKGFLTAISTESSSTICGMDNVTISYLCAALAYEVGDYEGAQKFIAKVFVASNANRRMKDRGYELKNMIMKELKKVK